SFFSAARDDGRRKGKARPRPAIAQALRKSRRIGWLTPNILVPTLCVGTALRPLCGPGSSRGDSSRRRASQRAFPRRAWEREVLLVKEFGSSQQVRDHAAPGPDGVMRVGHRRPRGVLVDRRAAVITLLLFQPLLLARVLDDARKQPERPLDLGGVHGVV